MTELDAALARLRAENEELRERVREAEEAIRAIGRGEADAVVVESPQGPQVYTLRGADHIYRVMVEQMNQAAASVTHDGILLFCNDRFVELVGRRREALVGSPLEKLVAEGELDNFRSLLSRGFRERAQGELSIRGPSGAVQTYASLSSLLLGTEKGVCVALTDLTEQKRNEQTVAAGRLATAILEQIGEATVVCDPEGKILRASRVARRLAGCEATGRRFAELFPLETESGERFDLFAVRPGGSVAVAARYPRPGAGATHFLVNATVLVDDEGAHLGWVVSMADISAQKEVEQALRCAREAAESAARAKSDFLANMSHEIRTPMNAVIGFTDLLLASSLTHEQRRYLDLVKGSGEALLAVVNDVLDLSKMEAGKFDLMDEAFDVRDLTDRVGRTLGLRAHQKGLELTSYIPFSVPTRLIGDPARLRQVLVNLVGNAVKFTEKGEVHLSVGEAEAPGGTDGRLWLRVSVRDTGIGIPPEKFDGLFQSFHQLDASRTRRQEGTGLGLFISRRIVEQMGGTIEARSDGGKGSTFSFTVPFRVQQDFVDAGACEEEVPELRGAKALVVDDNANNRMILLGMLANQGMEVAVTRSGEEALGLLRSANRAKRPFEVLVVDCWMPEMDGFQLIDRVREDPKCPPPVILMLTSDDLASDCVRAKEAGAAGYLVKPVSYAELVAAVRAVLGSELLEPVGRPEVCPAPQEEIRQAADGGSLRVLLAEDNRVNQLLVRALVEREGWSIHVVEDGRAALEALSREAFDAVLMDVQMPVLDGYDATRAFRSMEREAEGMPEHTPVIGLTAHALREDRQRCLEAGMDDYLSKPVDPQDLREAIRRHVQRASAGRERRRPPAELSRSLRENPALLRRVADVFLRDLPRRMGEIRDAVGRRSGGEIANVAHTLLGSLLVVGAARSAETARRLEACAKEGRLDEAPALCESLERELRRLADFLDVTRQ